MRHPARDPTGNELDPADEGWGSFPSRYLFCQLELGQGFAIEAIAAQVPTITELATLQGVTVMACDPWSPFADATLWHGLVTDSSASHPSNR